MRRRIDLEVQQRGLATPPNALRRRPRSSWARRVGRYATISILEVFTRRRSRQLNHTSAASHTQCHGRHHGTAILREHFSSRMNVFVKPTFWCVKADDRWLLAECKAAAKVKSEHLWDLALGTCPGGMGVKLSRQWDLVHLDSRSYVYDGREIIR